MIRPISNRNGLVCDLITLTFGAEYVLKQSIVRQNVILPFLPVKKRVYATENFVLLPTLPFSYHLVTAYDVTIVRLTAWPICGVIMHFSQ